MNDSNTTNRLGHIMKAPASIALPFELREHVRGLWVENRSRRETIMVKKFLLYSISLFLLTMFIFTLQTKTAYAYIDLGTGSYIFQLLIATFLASLYMVKVYWRRLTGQISRLFEKSDNNNAESD